MNDMVQRLGRSVARVRDAAGNVVGAGFLIAPDTVCTCAHVVAQALREPGAEVAREAPAGRVLVDFPLRDGGGGPAARHETYVVAWRPVEDGGSGDIALLRLPGELPGPSSSVPMVGVSDVWDHRFRVLGFPRGSDHGVWTAGRLRAAVGAGWVAMDEDGSDHRISHGYSGSPVWDVDLGGVVGMMVAAERGSSASTAYLIPSAALLDMQPGLRRCPYRGLEAFREEDAEFFHGREDDTSRVVEGVLQHPIVTVVGPSGSGKSSLVRAGVIPALRRKGFTVTTCRPVHGARPVRALADALLAGVGESPVPERLERLTALLGSGNPGSPGDTETEVAAFVGAELLELGGPAGHVLFLDQMEEIVGAAPAEARRLLNLAIAMARAAHPVSRRTFRLVATLRSGSLDGVLEPATARLLGDGAQFLAPPGRDALLRAVTLPTARVPGLAFESGLPERIVDDADEEPGYLPLVEFVLTRLWEERQGSLLTHAGYDRLGGVGGALSAYAEEKTQPIIDESGNETVRRLFAQLARPDDSGNFSRIALDLATLEPNQQALARTLARTRLVVFNHGLSHEQTVDLAHEALISQWPRLKNWLQESREFRTWQEQNRRSMAGWRGNGHDTGSLLRGILLGRALEWLARRPDDITADERRYIELSRRHQQRSIRRWRGVTAVITALALTAGLLTAYAFRNNADLQKQLHILASSALGDESEARAETEPGTALQLALAAWHNSPTPKAYQALLRQYLVAHDAARIHPALLSAADSFDATPDGRVLVTKETGPSGSSKRITLWTGLADRTPEAWRMPDAPDNAVAVALSDDGHYLAASCADGRVMLWDTKARTPGRVMPESALRHGVEMDTVALDFSTGAQQRLLHVTGTQDNRVIEGAYDGQGVRARVWDVTRLLSVAVHRTAIPRRDPEAGPAITDEGEVTDTRGFVTRAALTDDGKALIVQSMGLDEGGSVVQVRRLDEGKLVRSFKRSWGVVERGGAVLVQDRNRKAHVVSLQDGQENGVRVPAIPGDPSRPIDVSGRYFVRQDEGGLITLIDIREGRQYQAAVPSSAEPLRLGFDILPLLAVRQPSGDVQVTSIIGSDVWVLKARRAVGPFLDPEPGAAGGEWVVESPDGHYSAGVNLYAASPSVLVATRGGDELRQIRPAVPGQASLHVTFTADSRRLVVWNDSRVLTYSLPQLHLERAWGSGRNHIADVATTSNDQLMILTEQALLQFSAAIGATQTEIDQVCTNAGIRTGSVKCLAARPRPGRSGQTAVLNTNGRVQLWSTRTRKPVQTWNVGSVLLATEFFSDRGPVLTFSPNGEYVVVRADVGMKVWNANQPHRKGIRMSGAAHDEIIGFGPDNTLLSLGIDQGAGLRLNISDIDTGFLKASAPMPDMLGTVWKNSRKELEWLTANGRIHLPLDPGIWFRRLCAVASRDYTEAEKRLLPAGADAGSPCGKETGSV